MHRSGLGCALMYCKNHSHGNCMQTRESVACFNLKQCEIESYEYIVILLCINSGKVLCTFIFVDVGIIIHGRYPKVLLNFPSFPDKKQKPIDLNWLSSTAWRNWNILYLVLNVDKILFAETSLGVESSNLRAYLWKILANLFMYLGIISKWMCKIQGMEYSARKPIFN